MALGNLTGVFSRYFVVGFFLPAYISLVVLWLAASHDLIPDSLERHSETTQLAILGGVALVVALALSGLSSYITRSFEGYPLERMASWPLAGRLHRAAVRVQRRRYDRLLAIRDDKQQTPRERGRAAWYLDQLFPQNPDRLMPTRIGNAIRAFEQHSNTRWGLDGVTVWPRVEALLSAEERELIAEAKMNFYVFTNTALGAFIVGAFLAVDKGVNIPDAASYWPFYLIPFVLGYIAYRSSLASVLVWGDHVRAGFDLHRLELYEKLGVRGATSFSDERQLAAKVNKALLFGHPPLDDSLWRGAQAEPIQRGAAEDGVIAKLTNWLRRGA